MPTYICLQDYYSILLYNRYRFERKWLKIFELKHLLTVTRAVIRTRPTIRTVSQDERNVLTHGIDTNATDTDQYNFTESRSMTSVTVLVYSKCTVHETFRF